MLALLRDLYLSIAFHCKWINQWLYKINLNVDLLALKLYKINFNIWHDSFMCIIYVRDWQVFHP